MARYILINRPSGYIFGDTADVDGETLSLGTGDDDIIAACRAVDGGNDDYRYEILGRFNPRLLAANETGYLVYRADINGSEAVPVVWDGQDRETIEAIERDCELVAVVRAVLGEERI